MSVVLNENIGQMSPATRTKYESVPDYIKITDEDTAYNLKNYCYVSDPVDSDVLRENLDMIKDCRGVVFHGDEVVMKAFPFTDEVGVQYDLDSWFRDNGGFENCRFFESHEGALIRMFYHSDKWFLTTHRRLNAFKSKWGSFESYGAIFKKALKHQIDTNERLREIMPTQRENFYDNFTDILDKEKQYTFLVRNTPDNRLVCNGAEVPTMYHVGTFKNGVNDLDDDIRVDKPKELTFEDTQHLRNFVESCDPRFNPGIIIFGSRQTQLKVSSRVYLDMIHVRGNQPSVRYRYLQVRLDSQCNGMLRTMYPELVDTFDLYEMLLSTAVEHIHTAYMNRFIHKEHVRVSQAEYAIVRQAHEWFKEGRELGESRKVTKRVIQDILNTQPATTLNAIVKKLKHDEQMLASTDDIVGELTQSVSRMDVDEGDRA